MTAAKSWNKLSSVLSDVLSSTLKKSEVDNVMSAWSSKKTEVSKLMGSESRSAKTKAKKDPNAPRKARSGYIIFCEENRERAKVGLDKPTEITSRLGEMWNALTDPEREKYTKKALADKERFSREMASYTPPPSDGTEEPTTGRRTRVPKKERTGPRRPQSAYLYFCAEARAIAKAENPELSAKDMMQELGHRWNTLTAEERVPYEAKQVVDKARYEAEKVSGAVSSAKETTTPAKSTKKKAEVKAVPVVAEVKAAPVKAPPAKTAPVKAAPVKATPVKAEAKTSAKSEPKSAAKASKGKESARADKKPVKVKETAG